MKAKLHKLIGTAVLGLALCSHSLPAWAGAVSHPQVSIGPAGAGGSMAGARYSADSQQYIFCSAYSFSDPTFPPSLTACQAMDETGKTLFCSSTDPRFADAVKAMTDSSHLYFAVTSNGGACSELTVTNDSVYLR